MCGTGKQPISHPVPRGVTDACIWRPEILCVERYRMGYVRNWKTAHIPSGAQRSYGRLHLAAGNSLCGEVPDGICAELE